MRNCRHHISQLDLLQMCQSPEGVLACLATGTLKAWWRWYAARPARLSASCTRRRFWFLLSSWMGSEAVRGSFKARGYLLGTSQVRQMR